MKCFEHSDRDAVGICIACFKARCRECIVDHGRMVSCKGLCEHEARRLIDLRDFSLAQPSIQEKHLKWAHGTQLRASIFVLACGAGLVAWGLISQFKMVAWIGAVPAAYGLISLLRGRVRTSPKQFRLCPKCGYDVSHSTIGKCPECGYLV
jgi:hypothetical protein